LEENTLHIVVKDDGIGIPENELERLFSKFFRASNAQAHQTQGTGLGLYVVKQSVEKLGGVIEVTSKEDEGTQFSVSLPVSVLSNVSNQ
jgi:signal transduction histidine kinase